MRANSGRRVRRTREDWAKIYQRFDTSGLSSREFCQREDVPLSSFQRSRPHSAPRAVTKFVEVKKPVGAPEATSWELEVSLPNGVHLQFRG